MTASIPYPPRLTLARTPTPLDRLGRFEKQLGVELYLKRDDMTGSALSGNKVRKLEFVLADALHHGSDIVLTCGGAQSNHCRATAVASAKLGLGCRLLLRTPDPQAPPITDGNILMDRLCGADIVWITPDEYSARDRLFERETERLRREGARPYIIPEGASDSLGAWGYIRACEELVRDIGRLPGGFDRPTTVVHATGSGGTDAGLIIGNRLLGSKLRVVNVNVCDDRDYFIRVIGNICEEAVSRFGLGIEFSPDRDIEIIDGYVGAGYGISRPEELRMIRDLARTEGIFLDPVYTGKAFYGMVKEIERSPGCLGERIVFIHTGGMYGLFPKAAEIAPLL